MINCFIVTLQVLVGEPSVPDTVQILRGLKERYASHHGVQVGCWAGWESR
jgi:ATP-dependent Clp protease ATP-binding subunit ClpA